MLITAVLITFRNIKNESGKLSSVRRDKNVWEGSSEGWLEMKIVEKDFFERVKVFEMEMIKIETVGGWKGFVVKIFGF